MSIDQTAEPWTYARLRSRLSVLIEVLPLAKGKDEHAQKLLAKIHGDLIEFRKGFDKWHGEGIFEEGKEEK